MYGQQEILRALDEEYTDPIRDPLWRDIRISPALMSLVDTAEFQQLHRIRQLGPTALVYPGATHTRFSHSLGVFHIARKLLQNLLLRRDAPELSPEGVRAYLAAALLHDLGHFPYTHSLKSLPLLEHEALTGRIVMTGAPARRLRENLGVSPEMVAAIVDESLPDQGNREIPFFRRLLSGSLDPDKLDYLNRDARFCGVPYGLQDLDFALARVIPLGFDGIAVDAAGVSAVENVLFSKYLMYRSVYWHRTVRVATAMIRKAVFLALRQGELKPELLYNLDDDLLYARLGDSAFPPLDLVRRVGARNLLKTAAEIPFDETNPRHRTLEDNERRFRLEQELARELKKRSAIVPDHEVIVDLPDPVSFEANFPVIELSPRGEILSEPRPFPETSVFNAGVVERFTTTLRRFRLIVPAEIAESLPDPMKLFTEMIENA